MNRLLLLDGHEPDFAPATLEITNHLEAARQNIGRSHLLQQSLFPTEILPVLIVHRSEMSGLALEESVARRTEPFPDLVGIAARHGPRLLPLGLQCDQLIGRLLPLLAVAQRFGRLAQLGLELEVVLHLALQPGIVGTLGLEEFVAGIAETLVDGIVIFLGSESDRFPDFLYLEELLARLVPLFARSQRLLRQLFGLDTKLALEFQIAELLLLDILEKLLMLLVDTARSLLETIPQHLFIFIGHRADFTPFVVQLLQFVERFDDRRFEHQRFGLFAQGQLLLVILLQIEIAQLLVDLDEIVEILHVQVVGLPQILHILLGHHPGLFPTMLQLPELVESLVEHFVRRSQLLEFLDDLQLYLEVLLLGRFESGDELVPQTAVLPEKILETQLRRIRLGNEFTLRTAGFDKSPSCGIGLRPTQFVKRYLEGLHIPAQGLHRALFEHPGENRQQLLLRLARQVAAGRVPACGLLLGRSLAQVEPCVFGSQCCIFVGEVHPTLCRHVGIVRNCGIRFPAICGHGIVLRILNYGRVEMFPGNRKSRIFSSHLV